MANVMFKRGLHANLPTTGIVDGSFYLTTDTNRLYVGQTNDGVTSLVELNKSITSVKTQGQLPTSGIAEGQFYYVSDDNILCYYKEGSGWVQVNPDATLKDSTTAVSVGSTTGGAIVTTTVTDTEAHTVKGNFGIIGDDATTVTKDGNNVKISSHDTKSALTTTASAAGGKLNLTEDGTIASTITIKSGANVTVTSDDAGVITINAADNTSTAFNKAISAIFGDGTKKGAGNSPTLAKGELELAVQDGDGWVKTSITPTIKYGEGYGTTAVFDGGTANLDVYTKEETAKLIRTADALVFRGVIDTGDLPAITAAQNGDTYKIGSVNNPNAAITGAEVGDLVIAHGTESSSTGLITSGSWQIVPSGDDQLLEGRTDTTNHEFSIYDRIASDTIGSIKLVDGGENIKLTSTATGTGNKSLVTTITHDVAGAVDSSKTVSGTSTDVIQGDTSTAEFTAITKLEMDANGHIVSASTKKITVTDTHNDITKFALNTAGGSTSVIGTPATVTYNVTTKDGTSKSPVLTIDSDSLLISQTVVTADNASTVSVDIAWGSF